jgi:uncharacterized protein (TIGR02391 family)
VPYNLTEGQKELMRSLVQEVRAGNLPEEFSVLWVAESPVGMIVEHEGGDAPQVTQGALDALTDSNLIISEPHYRSHGESSRTCTLVGNAFAAVDSDFDAPDTSFVTQLTPLADITNLDDELKQRVLPILGAGSADPMMWDSAVRTAVVILEQRMRTVGGIADRSRVGRALVNDLFGKNGTLADRFANESEQQGYRELYAGIVGVFRNSYAHRLVDPTPEDGGAFIVFVNLLLKRLEDLREPTAT